MATPHEDAQSDLNYNYHNLHTLRIARTNRSLNDDNPACNCAKRPTLHTSESQQCREHNHAFRAAARPTATSRNSRSPTTSKTARMTQQMNQHQENPSACSQPALCKLPTKPLARAKRPTQIHKQNSCHDAYARLTHAHVETKLRQTTHMP